MCQDLFYDLKALPGCGEPPGWSLAGRRDPRFNESGIAGGVDLELELTGLIMDWM